MDNDGLIEISSLTELHNMRYDLAGTSYKSSPDADGNSAGCKGDEVEEDARVCFGYELMENLDFDGDKDGRTWSGSGDEGFRLDRGDSQADYFPVDEDGAGGWEPIGDEANPFAATFDGNGRTISNLAISRSETFYVGLFGRTGAAAVIRNIGLVDNLADYSGSSNNDVYIGGLVGLQYGGSITASYATGPAAGGDGDSDFVGGLVGRLSGGSITASYATGPAAGGAGNRDFVGGLVGFLDGGSITASYATGPAAGGDGKSDIIGGLVGYQTGGSITASYATGPATGGDGGGDFVGGLVGSHSGGLITASYGFGRATGEIKGSAGSAKPEGVETAAQLTAANVVPSWNDASSNTLDAWSFGGDTPTPALQYADYDGDGNAFDCGQFPDGACGTLLPMQVDVDVDNDGLIEISSLTELHNMRYNLAGTSYKTSTASVGNSAGCNEDEDEEDARVCFGYELMENLDFDGDKDGRTWSGSGDEGFRLDEGDSQADYFPVDESGTGGWLPIGDEANPFAAVFDGNGRTISNLAISRDQTYVGLFGFTSGAVIRNIGLINNLANYIGTAASILVGGLAGGQQDSIVKESYATGVVYGGSTIGGLVGSHRGGSITASYATSVVYGAEGGASVGGLVGYHKGGSITASYATSVVYGGEGGDKVGGLVGVQDIGSIITASYATGAAAGGDGTDIVGGLVGFQNAGSITASYATGDADGGAGNNDYVGGLAGQQNGGSSITASYATGAADGGAGNSDNAGGLVGLLGGGSSITASYATGPADGGGNDLAGGLVGNVFETFSPNLITSSYGFGSATGKKQTDFVRPSIPEDVSSASQLRADNAGPSWTAVGNNTLNAWNFGTETQLPALNYADYDGEDGLVFDCSKFPAAAATECNDGDDDFTLLPGQADVSAASNPSVVEFGEIVSLTGSLKFGRVTIESWRWRQLAGPDVIMLSDAATSAPTFTAPLTKEPLVFELTAEASDGLEYSDRISIDSVADRDGNGLIEIHSLIELHNMRHNLTGTSYKASATSAGNSFGCPEETGCIGYELMQHLDFDVDEDGRTWSGNGDDGYTLDADDHRADYFPVDEDGAGGWLPIGDEDNPFAAVFDGNGYSIRNLAISRDQAYVGFFGRTGASAAIRNLGLVDNLADYSGSSDSANYIGGLAGYNNGGLITASYVTGVVDGGDGNNDRVGGLVGWQSSGSITESYATGAADGRDGNGDRVGGLVGHQINGIITASYATGVAAGGDGKFDYVGGLVGHQINSIITASYATGPADGGDGGDDKVGGLVGYIISVSITASYATGAAAGGDGDDDKVGGLVGQQEGGGSITASYATGPAAGGDGNFDYVGGLVGFQLHGSITASYATGPAAGGEGDGDSVGGLVGLQAEGSITESYGFGVPDGEVTATVGLHPTLTLAVQLTAGNAGSAWDDAGSNTLNAWDFGTETQIPALNYADYDDIAGEVFACADFPTGACPPPTLLPGQDEVSVDLASSALEPGETVMLAGSLEFGRIRNPSWSWRQLAGPTVTLSVDDARETTFTAPLSKEPMLFELTATGGDGHRRRARISLGVDVDRNDNGLIEIDSLLDLHNMRHNLAGTSYRASSSTPSASVGNSFGCPDTGCFGYELMRDLDFDGDDDDGGTWSGNGDDGYTLDSHDHQADYFPVDEDGAGGWLPIGDGNNPFAAVFDGNGRSIRNLAIRRDQTHVGLFGAIGDKAAIRNLGLIDNLVDYTGNSDNPKHIGGLAGRQQDSMVTTSYATGPAAGGDGVSDLVGGLVGLQEGGSITASWAAGSAAGGDGNSDSVGGLVGVQFGGSITASYATGAAAGGGGSSDYVGGLVGQQAAGSITASYATGVAAGGGGGDDNAGGLVGLQAGGSSITESYGFGEATGELEGPAGPAKPEGVETAAQLTAANAGMSWNDAGSNTLDAWYFGDGTQIPALNYADYDGGGDVFACADFPAGACGTLLPGQRYAVVVSVARLEVDEGGSASYSLRLASAPTGRVEVRVVVPSAYQDSLRASPASLFFDDVAEGQEGHWETDQRVTLSLDEDGLSSGTRVLTIGHAIDTSDLDYEDLEVPSVEVTLIDDEKRPELILTLSPDNAAEGSSSDPSEETSQNVVRVRVTAGLEGPARSVDTVVTLTVGVASDSAGEDEYRTDLPADATLTIPAAATASEPLVVVVTLFQDRIVEGDRSFTVRAFADVLGAASATFVIADDDRAGVEVTLEPRNVREGEEISYDVVLTSEPAADVEVAVTVEPVAGSEAVLTKVELNKDTLTFDSDNWYEPQTVILTVAPEVTVFGGLDINHRLTSTDANYAGLTLDAIRLELVDVDASLQSLELRLAAAGEPLVLLNADGDDIGFSAHVRQYFATVPFPAASAFITATPAVAADISMNGEVVQRRAEVRIFRAEQDKGEDVAGKETSVDLPGNEDRFAFDIEVSVQPSVDGGEVVMQNYSLTLTRALPADAELRVYRAADGERETPITEDLNFGADDDDMDLILILSRGGNISYNISEIAISGSDDRFEEAVGIQIELEGGGFETPVTLRRVDDDAAGDVPYSLTFTATPERPPADDANLPSATIAGTLKANIATETEISATYRSHSQGQERPITFGDGIRVSANGPVTITLNVGYLSGGNRAVEPSDFIFSFVGGVAGSIQDNILEIQPGPSGQVTVEVTAASSLDRINPPAALAFTLSFESPRALIQPAADPNPLLAFREPFLAFVGEDNKLPLEVVLAADSIPLAGSDDILGKLQLTVTLAVAGGDIQATTVAIAAAAADDGLPGRDLAFAVSAPKNSVTVAVAVASGRENELVDVAELSFIAHFLSLEHPDGIEFSGNAEVFDIALRGEDPDNDSWTFEIINSAEFEGHGYRVEEVALTGTELIYEASTAESYVETRHLRVTGNADAVNSRVVLEFKYLLDGGAAGVFTRTIRLTSGREADLEVAVIPGTLVLPQGGSGQVKILISNLALDDDPAAADSIEITADADADLRVELQGSGRLDRINNRFEQTLEVRAAADAGRPEYTVRVEVRLPGNRAASAELRVDINDAPQYKGDTALTVYESGDGRVMEFPLRIFDPDGGMRFLDATELSLEVIGFEDSFKVASNDGHANRYFDLAFSGISAVGQEGPPNGKSNSLSLALTLSGKLATPFNSIVELRLFGVTDGFNDFEQRLTVGVKNRPPQFELAETLGVKVFLEREPTAIPLQGLEEGAKVLVLEAPADLVVKFDETAMEVTLRRLDTDLDGNGLSNEVELVALDAQGGRAVVSIEILRPLRLPQIVPPPPLLIAAGQSGTLQLQLAADTGLNVTWTIAVADSDDLDDFIEEDYGLTKVAGGHAELRLTLADSVAAGVEFDLWVTAYVGEEAGGYRRTARLPVVVAVAKAKPRLQLSATLADPENPAAAEIVVSSFAPTESLSIDVELKGEVPSIYEGDDATAPPSFQISIFKLDASGVAVVDPIMDVAESKVVDGELKIDSVVFGEERIAELSLDAGDAVRVSVGLPPDSTGVSDEIIAGASLVLRVSEKAVKDVDNDGLADDTGEDTVPEILGPIAAAVAGVTASGVASAGADIAVSLSLGETSRLLGLGECGGVSLSLTLTLTLSEDGAAASLSGCSGAAIDAGPLFAAETLVALGIEEDEVYRLFDISATFDSSEAGGGGFLVISLPLDPQQPYVVYRYDEDGNDGDGGWVPVEAAGLPGQPGQAGHGGGGQGALADFESDCGSCFYAFDLDRDGAVQLLLLLVPMDAAAGSEFALDDAALEGRQLEISADESTAIALVGLEGLTVEIRGAAIAGGNVTGTVSAEGGVVELIGLRRTANGPEELLVEAFAEDGRAVATISLYVRVPNQPPEVSFFMQRSGAGLTTTVALAANSETVLTVMVEDADGDADFILDLRDERGNDADGGGVAKLVSRLIRGAAADGGEDRINHELRLSSIGAGAGAFEVKLRVLDPSDGSESFAKLSGCVLDGRGQCPASTGGGDGGGGGGGGTGGGGGGSLGAGALVVLALPLLLGRRRWWLSGCGCAGCSGAAVAARPAAENKERHSCERHHSCESRNPLRAVIPASAVIPAQAGIHSVTSFPQAPSFLRKQASTP